MSYRTFAVVLIAPLALTVACSKTGAGNETPAAERVATVNGEPISRSEFDLYLANVSRQMGRPVPPEQHPEILDQYISMKLAAEAAEKEGLTKDPHISDQLELARMNVLVDASVKKYLEAHPVEESELKPEYDRQVEALPREYHARHILVEDEASAIAITREIEGGADFAKVAAKKSKDASGKNGGDLGWFTLDTMVPPFAEAVASLEPGQMTKQPVQSQFGWHVIKLEESRAASAPPFEDVKEQVRALVQRRKLQTYLEELRKGAKIEKSI